MDGLVVERPLAALLPDMDSKFAPVKQHLDPSLRGRPVGVAPVMAESSCCIAASYGVKAFAVKTEPAWPMPGNSARASMLSIDNKSGHD